MTYILISCDSKEDADNLFGAVEKAIGSILGACGIVEEKMIGGQTRFHVKISTTSPKINFIKDVYMD